MASASDLIELKDGKVIFKQKPLKWEDTTTTLKELIAFSDFLKLPSTSVPLTQWPNDHLPLVAKLIHESEKALLALSKHVKKLILRRCGSSSGDSQEDKALVEDPRIPLEVISKTIESIAVRTNYGIEGGPPAVTFWRWEVRSLEEMLPSPTDERACNAEAAARRQEERARAVTSLRATFEGLSSQEKEMYLKRGKRKDKGEEIPEETGAGRDTQKETKPTKQDDDTEAKKSAAVMKEKLKENKGPTKQAKAFTAFFSRNAKPAKPLVTSKPSSSQTDFQKTFKSYVLKKDIRMAPPNRFIFESATHNQPTTSDRKGKRKELHKEVIVLDEDGDVEMESGRLDVAVVDLTADDEAEKERSTIQAVPQFLPKLALGNPTEMTNAEILHEFLSTIPSYRLSRRTQTRLPNVPSSNSRMLSVSPSKRNVRLKTTCPNTVRAVMTRLTEAEVTGDTRLTRKLQRMLKNRKLFTAKVLSFSDNLRPGYFGTWTKSSPLVGPRTPFAKDLAVFDYSYDSGEEWEEEPEDAEEVNSVGDESESAASDDGDELEGWLVGDDDVEDGPEGSRSRSTSPPSGLKRKEAVAAQKDDTNKRRKVVPLVPFIKGPCWETNVGSCGYEPFHAFRVQLLNDTPYPIDPFTFVSAPLESNETTKTPILPLPSSTTVEAHAHGSGPSTTTIPSGTFVIPALPPHLHPSNQINLPQGIADLTLSKTSKSPKRPEDTTKAVSSKPAKSKKPFPPAYIPQLLGMIEGSTKTKAHLVEEVAAFFKEKGVPKYSVEPAINDVAAAVKDGASKTWRVKPEVWVREGLTPQTLGLAQASG